MKNEEQNAGDDESKGERIAKRMARAGVCSRRDAEKLIAEGRVKLNGEVLETPAVTVRAESRKNSVARRARFETYYVQLIPRSNRPAERSSG